MTDELTLPINIIPNMDAVDAALKKIEKKPIISKLPGQSTKSLLSRWGGTRYEKPPKTMLDEGVPSRGKDPFTAFKKDKTDSKIDIKNTFDALKNWGRIFKIDLYWRWLKGMFFSVTKYMPMLGKFGEIITAALTLIFTALLLPFLPGILESLKWLLEKSVAFFNYMKGLEGLSPSVMAEKIVTDLNKFFADTPWEEYGKTIGTKINEGITFVDDILKKIPWDAIGESVGKAINGIVETLDGKKIGELIATGINSVVKFLDSVFDNVKWDEIGTKIGDFFSAIVLKTDWWSIGDLIGSAFLAAIKAGIIGIPGGLIKGGLEKGHEMTKELGERLDKKPEDVTIWDKLFPGWDKVPTLFLPTKEEVERTRTEPLVIEKSPEERKQLETTGLMGPTNININGLVDENKYRAIVREELDRYNRRLPNSRGAVGI